MTLNAGHNLTHYEILGPLGAGSMGEVWRARDTRLEREVALKVLPDELADDEERLRRFEREAKTLASLNHPNVAHVYDIDQVEDTCFIAMELVPGEDLAERLRRGRLPLEEAVGVCCQIADGLEAAHEAGVIHRDLKPANVRITPEGRVKVLDFGLAKPTFSSEPSSASTDAGLTTDDGRVLGTPAYMAPEQVRGKAIDKRVDVFAFGCVLFQCLTGRRAFDGETLSDVLAAVLEKEPDLSLLPRETPLPLRNLLRRCLRKDVRERMRDIGDVCLLLQEAGSRRSTDNVSAEEAARLRRSRALAGAFGVLSLAVAVFAVWGPFSQGITRPAASSMRWSLDVPEGAALGWRGTSANLSKLGGGSPLLSVSADGRRVAYCVNHGTTSEIHVQDLGEDFISRPIAGTEDARAPFLSPQGDWLGFQAGAAIQIVSVDRGGAPQPVHGLSTPNFAASWTPDGEAIVYTANAGLWRVRKNGADAELLAAPRRDEGEVEYSSPSVLPDGEGVLFTVSTGRRSHVAFLSLATREVSVVVGEGTNAHLLPDGRFVYAQGGGVRMLDFDPTAGEFAPVSEPVLDGVFTTPSAGGSVMAHYAVSHEGTLVYAPASAKPMSSIVTWVDTQGRPEKVVEESGFWEHMRLSPDGTRFACDILDEHGVKDVFIYEFARRSLDPLTTDGTSIMSAWSPDGFLSVRSTIRQSVIRNLSPADATVQAAPPISVSDAEWPVYADCWSTQGDTLFLTRRAREGRSIWSYTRGDEGPVQIVEAAKDARFCSISPDGRWLAYTATEPERRDVFVRPYPDLTPRIRISNDGGAEPLWSDDGATIYYRRGSAMLAVSFDAESSRPGATRELFEEGNAYDWDPGGHCHYDFDHESERFLMVEHRREMPRRIHVVLDWIEELAPPR